MMLLRRCVVAKKLLCSPECVGRNFRCESTIVATGDELFGRSCCYQPGIIV